MTVPSRPIPALYTVYILRSTMRHASLYIGSTTDPPRRLKQHNGEIRGGAVRTARPRLRPWEMVGLVSGFPGAVAALKFEWALTNPHVSLHIPSESRLSVFRQRKRNGQPRRPRPSLQSVLANVHLLLRVPSFARWPLRLHLFSRDAHAAWTAWCESATQSMPSTFALLTDFGPEAETGPAGTSADGAVEPTPWGIHALPLDYTHLRDYVDKARDIFTFQREGNCAICHEAMPPDQGLYVVCPNTGCEAVGHLRCWGEQVLASEGKDEAAAEQGDNLMPVRGHCPECGGEAPWADMMKELTLRLRAPKEVDKLVKAKRREEKVVEKAERATEKARKAEEKAVKAAEKAAEKAAKAAEKARKSAEKRAKSPRATVAKAKASTTASKTTARAKSPRKSQSASPKVIVLDSND